MATKKELQAELEALGIPYRRSDTRAELLDMLADAQEAALAEPDPDEEPEITDEGNTATSYEDVTGLCRQCGKPADHLHIGI